MGEDSHPMQFPANWSGFGPKMLALGERERKFVWAYLINTMNDDGSKSGHGAQSARDAGYSDVANGAKVRAHGLLHRQEVVEAIQEVAARELKGMVLPAVAALGRLLHRPDHPDHRKAAETILDRVGMGTRTALDVNVSGSVTVNHTDEALEQLRMLLELGVPREKLVETFGFSGLGRYERMLAEKEGRSPKVIEHMPAERRE